MGNIQIIFLDLATTGKWNHRYQPASNFLNVVFYSAYAALSLGRQVILAAVESSPVRKIHSKEEDYFEISKVNTNFMQI